MIVSRPWKLVGVVMLGAGLASCAGGNDAEETVSVFAAASLTDAFAELEADFEALHPEFDLELNLGGSSSLREQVRQGAPADVIATANEEIVQSLIDEGLATGPASIFATNALTIAVPADNPGSVTAPVDLERPDLIVGLCAASVPCGGLAREALANLGVEPSIDTNEPDVRALLTKIELGEIDAGVVYATDVLAANDAVRSITLVTADGSSDDVDRAVASYPVATLTDAPNSAGAQAFVDFVLSNDAAEVLSGFGFGPGR